MSATRDSSNLPPTHSPLAWCSAAISCRKTLLWDLDAAGGAGFLYGVDPKKKHAAESVFSKDADPEHLIRKTEIAKLDVLPADESLRELDSLFERLGKGRRLAKLTETLARRYERIILDCPPVLNEISAQVVRAADCVVVPLPPSPLSARAFELVSKEIEAHAKGHPPILPVISMLDRRRTLHREAREATRTGRRSRWRARSSSARCGASRSACSRRLAGGQGLPAIVDRGRARADQAEGLVEARPRAVDAAGGPA
jgi:cellulose biosynthesis protein BcsQ